MRRISREIGLGQMPNNCSISSYSVAVLAVAANRSPVLQFPDHRENTGKFADFGLEIAKPPRLSQENSMAYQQNSLFA
jgi:hypothetical protein